MTRDDAGMEQLLQDHYASEQRPELSPSFEYRMQQRLALEPKPMPKADATQRVLRAYWLVVAVCSLAILTRLSPALSVGWVAWAVLLGVGLTVWGAFRLLSHRLGVGLLETLVATFEAPSIARGSR